jgi:UDP-galactopyranose mutase
VISKIGKELYGAFFKGYTEKQWGMPVADLEPSVTARIPIRFDTNDDYVRGRIQAVPQEGYTKMFEKMLFHENITIRLCTAFQKEMTQMVKKVIWTGKIDEFFDDKLGKLPYRSLRFEFSHHEKEYVQPYGQINFPEPAIPWTRTVEIKHVTGQIHPGTTISTEYPMSEGEPYYPIPAQKNHALYEAYLQCAYQEKDVIFIGRLATYKYMDMDKVAYEALRLSGELV